MSKPYHTPKSERVGQMLDAEARDAEAAAVSLRTAWGNEYNALDRAERILVAVDYAGAFREDGCTVSEYRRRIGNGNLASYAACLAAGAERRAVARGRA